MPLRTAPGQLWPRQSACATTDYISSTLATTDRAGSALTVHRSHGRVLRLNCIHHESGGQLCHPSAPSNCVHHKATRSAHPVNPCEVRNVASPKAVLARTTVLFKFHLQIRLPENLPPGLRLSDALSSVLHAHFLLHKAGCYGPGPIIPVRERCIPHQYTPELESDYNVNVSLPTRRLEGVGYIRVPT